MSAIQREKRIKRWPRAWKYDLIHKDKHGRFIKCPKMCRDRHGHFIRCG